MGAHSAWVARQLNNDKGEWRGSGWRHVDLDSERGRLVRELAEVDLRISGSTAKEADIKRRDELLLALAPAEAPEEKRPITWLDEEEEEGMAGLTDEQKRQKVVDFITANKGVARRSVLAHLGKGSNYRKHKELLGKMVEEGVIECHQSNGAMRMWIPRNVVKHDHAEVMQATSTTVELVDDDIAVMLVREREAEREDLDDELAAVKAERDQLKTELDAVKAERDQLNDQIFTLNLEACEGRRQNAKYKAERDELKAEIYGLQGSNTAEQGHIKELRGMVIALREETRRLDKSIQATDNEMASIASELEAMREPQKKVSMPFWRRMFR